MGALGVLNVTTETSQTRIRWDDKELGQVAAKMLEIQQAAPQTSLLDAVRQAQQVLPVNRQREIKTWAALESRLQPKLSELKAHYTQQEAPAELKVANDMPQVTEVREAPGASVTVGAPAEDPAPPAKEPDSGVRKRVAVAPQDPKPLADMPAVGTPLLDPLMVEAALLAALQSPAVSQALVGLFSRTMSEAFSRLSERGAPEAVAASDAPTRDARVLLAGFSTPETGVLEENLRSRYDVRTWRPTQGPQLFETLVKLCRIAVLPKETDDEVDAALKARGVVVLRHEGAATKLLERLDTLSS